MAIIRAEDLTYTKVRQLDMEHTVCFQPVSALEVHGPHLPLGMDFYMARWMAEETGRRFIAQHAEWTIVQLPPLPLGTDELPLAGSMTTNQRTVYNAVRAHGTSLAKSGYRYIVVTNGHGGPRHASGLEAACRWVSKKHGVEMFTPSIKALHGIITGQRFTEVETQLGRALTDHEKANLVGGEHAGGWETSFMLAQNPELVEPNYQQLGHDGPPHVPWIESIGRTLGGFLDRRGRDGAQTREIFTSLAGGIGWLMNTKYGYGGPAVTYEGTPAVASPELGKAFRHVMADECLKMLEAVTSGQLKATDVRSIASDPALIQPQFWPRVGIAAALLAALILF
jgi:creatinine amidohydrolase